MIRFQMLRHKNDVLPVHFTKIEKNLCKNIVSGLKSQPCREIQNLDLTIYDSPVKRFFFNMIGKKHNNLRLKMKAAFSRSFWNEKAHSFETQRYSYTDKFDYAQLQELKEGKELVHQSETFINKLVNNLNEAIEG